MTTAILWVACPKWIDEDHLSGGGPARATAARGIWAMATLFVVRRWEREKGQRDRGGEGGRFKGEGRDAQRGTKI